MTPLVVEDLTVTYPNGHRALDHVTLTVKTGERCAVVGRSGSGKTTLVHAILGLLPAGTRTAGSVRVAGREVLGAPGPTLRQLRGLLAGYVPQDPFAACDPLRTVGHHVAEAWTAHGRTPPAGAVPAALAVMGIDDSARRARHHPHQWSGGMLQRATLVAATAHTPALTLADEPTSALDAELADEALALLRRRCGALLLISHDLALVARHTESVLVLADGRAVERGPAATLLHAPAAEETRQLVAAATPAPRRAAPAARPGSVIAQVRGVSRRYGRGPGAVTALDDVSLALAAGEIVGVVGRSGSGKSTLARIVGGIERPDTGTVHLDGRDAWSRRRTLRPGFVMPIFQDPVASLDRRWALWRTLTEPLLARGERHPRARRRALAQQALARVGLAEIDVDRMPASLSVGQAQRVAIARAIIARPALLIADEPTASLDVAATAEITDLLRDIADDGTALLVVSHDHARLAGYADRVVTMTTGRLTHGGLPRYAAAG
ncbi:ABC transporter ATP-binding protein [Pseudonocardia asaccharolytica]|uniref:Peptide ABC transporter ATP-binding protein n=1 Tax=Pseudonocardia asaccharolytica DSM 44247 = NBRC 16224 TaxID=1123024 RepID=A0A511CYC7_9PSEU|nr:ATP-binding cassette domain-containing protein [Pseudonocardia asaccharolytica]GEL17551.1 peptide ABC transporter ATP-binding protein [Pseudonocardia asaccharolytica DSM 44247 = NBRC 16224]